MRKLLVALTAAALFAGLFAVDTSAAPPAQGARQARFSAAGDFGARAATTTAVLKGMAATKPSAALALGDLKYEDKATESDWCSYVKGIVGATFPFEIVSGNHESLDVANGTIENFAACLPNRIAGMKGTYGKEYFLDFPQTAPLVRVIQASPALTFTDGRWAYKAGDKHYQWLSSAIDSGRAAGAKWIIVTAHIPCWSVGSYNCPATDFSKLMLSKHVDLVLNGHEHAYMRTHQLASGVSGCATVPTGSYNAACVRDRDGSFAAGAGTVFATIGTGGTPLRTVNMGDSEAGYFAAVSGANRNPAQGFLDISVGEDKLSAKFVNTSGGSFTDAFSINRGAATAALASDTFSRSVAAGFGNAETGGAWTVTGSTSGYAVDGSNGLLKLSPGASRKAVLPTVSTGSATAAISVAVTGTISGGGVHVSLQPRVRPDSSAYRSKVWISNDGVGHLSIAKVSAGGAQTVLATAPATLSSVTSGRRVMVRTQVTGSSPTTVRARMWFAGTAEPSAWQVQVTDGTPALQGPGAVGVFAYESSSATGGLTVRVDDLDLRP